MRGPRGWWRVAALGALVCAGLVPGTAQEGGRGGADTLSGRPCPTVRTVTAGMAPPCDEAWSASSDALGWGLDPGEVDPADEVDEVDEAGVCGASERLGASGADRGRAWSGAQTSPGAGGDATRGRAAFDGVCGRCHPHGNEDVGPRLIGLGWPEARVRQQVRQGRRTMRPIPTTRLSDERLDDVIAYLRTLGTVR